MTEPKPSRDDEGYLRGWYLVETQGDYKRARQMAQQHTTYTEHRLTENQLRFLSQVVNNRQRNFFGPTFEVLLRHRLVTWSDAAGRDSRHYGATDAGREALTQARAEGW